MSVPPRIDEDATTPWVPEKEEKGFFLVRSLNVRALFLTGSETPGSEATSRMPLSTALGSELEPTSEISLSRELRLSTALPAFSAAGGSGVV
jgi:hypothetical protein